MARAIALCRHVTVVAPILALMTGCMPPPADPAAMARCNHDFVVWARYHYSQAVNHTGQKLRADYALYQCQLGRYHPAIEELEDILRRMKMPMPAAPTSTRP